LNADRAGGIGYVLGLEAESAADIFTRFGIYGVIQRAVPGFYAASVRIPVWAVGAPLTTGFPARNPLKSVNKIDSAKRFLDGVSRIYHLLSFKILRSRLGSIWRDF